MSQDLDELASAIAHRRAVVGTVGLGYVGLPVACMFAQAGFPVVGLDVDRERAELISSGISPIMGEPGLQEILTAALASGRLEATDDYQRLARADIVTINVQTPIGPDQQPDYSALTSASLSLGSVLSKGTLVVVESTVSPGTSAGLVSRTLAAASGLVPEVDFFVGACPERVMPGRLLANIRSVARVCGASSSAIGELMRSFYKTVVEAEIDVVDTTTAELVKVVENTYRDVQIAFANEIALVCADLGQDVWQVRSLVNKVPQRDMHYPGGGVGGHCIPKDPWLLASSARTPLSLIPAARKVNDSMPGHIADLVIRASKALSGRALPGRDPNRVLILGYSYLADSDDVRNSPSRVLVDHLQAASLEPVPHDPYVAGLDDDVLRTAAGCAIGVVMVPHRPYEGITLDLPVVIDARRLSDAHAKVAELEAGRDA